MPEATYSEDGVVEGEGTTIIGPRDSKEGVVIGDRLGVCVGG